MKQTILMERVLDETRVALIEDGALCELYIRHPGDENLSGNIYLGRVERVLPGMNAAFVDIGLDKNGFLTAGDIRLNARDGCLAAKLERARIEDLVRPGQEIPVQVVKSQPGNKGPRLSCHITLAGRLVALLTELPFVGVSRKIDDQDECNRLYAIGQSLIEGDNGGVILRTAAQGASEADIRADYTVLTSLWGVIKAHAASARAPRLLRDDGDLSMRVVRDLLSEDVEAVWADGADCYAEIADYARTFAPKYVDRIHRHDGNVPLFDLYRVDAQAGEALQKYVWLKNGGSLVIEETEALTVVDVNTGKNTGRHSADETLYENNREAARELMRQLRLRDIGGIIVVDFIDMRDRAQKEALLDLLRECAARDRNRVTVVDITPLGLVEMTRKKVRQSLSRQLTHTCSACGGNGVVPAHETTARRAARDVWRRRRSGDNSALVVEAAPAVCGVLRTIGVRAALKAVEDMGAGEYHIIVN